MVRLAAAVGLTSFGLLGADAILTKVTRTDNMGYTLKEVSNDGSPVQNGQVDVTNAMVSKATDGSFNTVSDTYDLNASCYYLETYSTASSTAYSHPETWLWNVGTEISGYGFDGGFFGVGGTICLMPECYADCRKSADVSGLTTDKCNNYGVLLKACSLCKGDDLATFAQMALDDGCAIPEPWTITDDAGLPEKKMTFVVQNHTEYNTTLGLLLTNTQVPDGGIPRSFQTQVEAGMATFLGAYPYSLVHLVEINGRPTASVIAGRRLREECSTTATSATCAAAAASPPAASAMGGETAAQNGRVLLPITSTKRQLTRLSLSVNAQQKTPQAQQSRYDFLEAKPQDDFAALGNQLRSTVALLKAPSTLLSTEGFSKTRTVVDSVTLDIKYFGPSPAPTPAPTAAPSIDPSKPGAGGLNPKDKPQKATSESKGGMSTAGKYAALAAAGLAGITVVYCCLGSALRNRKSVAADKEKEQARRKEDDEIFRRAQAANAAKLALANESTAVPLS